MLLGILAGAALTGGAGVVWLRSGDGCLGRCGEGTRCVEGRCAPAEAPAEPAADRTARPKRRRAAASGAGAAPEAALRPGDERMTARGDALGRSERIDFGQPGEAGRDLDEVEIDRVFKPAQGAISRCITEALGDFPLETGRVEIGFRVEAAGHVERVRVEAPALLQRRGLHDCVRRVVRGLRFPRSGGASVVSYPFQLQ